MCTSSTKTISVSTKASFAWQHNCLLGCECSLNVCEYAECSQLLLTTSADMRLSRSARARWEQSTHRCCCSQSVLQAFCPPIKLIPQKTQDSIVPDSTRESTGKEPECNETCLVWMCACNSEPQTFPWHLSHSSSHVYAANIWINVMRFGKAALPIQKLSICRPYIRSHTHSAGRRAEQTAELSFTSSSHTDKGLLLRPISWLHPHSSHADIWKPVHMHTNTRTRNHAHMDAPYRCLSGSWSSLNHLGVAAPLSRLSCTFADLSAHSGKVTMTDEV